jgi:CDP-diacylglycerol--glycerol-3-phosphate 3-phosphatidyltransferase
MVFISVALAPVLPSATVRTLAVVVLVPSLAVFARDYLVVSGHLPAGNSDA